MYVYIYKYKKNIKFKYQKKCVYMYISVRLDISCTKNLLDMLQVAAYLKIYTLNFKKYNKRLETNGNFKRKDKSKKLITLKTKQIDDVIIS